MSNKEFEATAYEPCHSGGLSDSGTSVFDPVLCELSYAWYTREGDRVIDPFAGGSVRGIVASHMGRSYTGVELRPEQVEANREQAAEICSSDAPEWIVGDSARIDELVRSDGYDFMFTCPPYADLEVYSDDPADISNMPHVEFIEAYRAIMAKAVAKLADDRFAVVVIGDARDREGFYYNLPGITVQAMEDAGARYYNEAILVTPAGSLPIRAGKQFTASRKLGKTHQNVLTFVKGDPKRATERLREDDGAVRPRVQREVKGRSSQARGEAEGVQLRGVLPVAHRPPTGGLSHARNTIRTTGRGRAMGRHRRSRRTRRKRRMCTEKRAFGSEYAAMRFGARWGQDWYRCPYCHMWHLTSRNSQPGERGSHGQA